jgi:membrane protein
MYVRALTRKLVEDDILFLASGLAFNGVLALIPLLLLSASALGIFLNSSELGVKQVDEILSAIFPPQPFATSIKESLTDVIEDIILYRGSIGLFGVVVLVWIATSLFDSLRSVLHTIYRMGKTKRLLVSLAHHVGFVFVVFLLFLATSGITWVFSLLKGLVRSIPAFASSRMPGLDETVPTIITTLLTAFMFYIIYRYIPDSKPPRAAGAISTVTTTILWVISGKMFAVYLSDFSAIGTIYGPYAFILVLLVWIYYSAIIFIVGGMVGQIYWERLTSLHGDRARNVSGSAPPPSSPS